MKSSVDWKNVWEKRATATSSDFQLDRGRSPQDENIEHLAEQALIGFIEPAASEIILDAGCGTGVNILRLHSRVRQMIGIDYSSGSLARCKRNLQDHRICTAQIYNASVTALPLADGSVDKVLCMSVFQYLNQQEVRKAIGEFVRVLKPRGTLILHVKNLSSLYWLTLLPAKHAKALLTGKRQIEYVRRSQWYFDALAFAGCDVLDYDSFNLLLLDMMPQKAVSLIRSFEVKHHEYFFFRTRISRRHGAELLIKAQKRV